MENIYLEKRNKQMTLHKTNFVLPYMFIVAILIFAIHSLAFSDDSTAVDKYGQLRVIGNKVVDKNGNPVMLHGMCLYWSQWKGQFYNYDCMQWLRDDWKCTVVRASMGVESGGYLTNPTLEKNKVLSVIDACIDLGIYVIVDWHDHNAQNHLSQSISFFEEIASDYKGIPNIIYEIYNEPLNTAPWTSVVKPYADSVVKHIRAIDSDNLIIVGTPTWSQDVDIASQNPLTYNNIAYALHFYAATHKKPLRDKATTALNRGVALFVSEFGTVTSSGDGTIDSAETDLWMKFMNDNKISWCNWSVADLTETSAALKPGANANGGWPDSDISISGLLIRRKLREAYESSTTSVGTISETTRNFRLDQNYPNPFNPTTVFSFQLSTMSKVKLIVYDVLGREVDRLIDEVKPAGVYKVTWNASALPSGVYLYQLQAANNMSVKKAILMK
jgi:endoglucanase